MDLWRLVKQIPFNWLKLDILGTSDRWLPTKCELSNKLTSEIEQILAIPFKKMAMASLKPKRVKNDSCWAIFAMKCGTAGFSDFFYWNCIPTVGPSLPWGLPCLGFAAIDKRVPFYETLQTHPRTTLRSDLIRVAWYESILPWSSPYPLRTTLRSDLLTPCSWHVPRADCY